MSRTHIFTRFSLLFLLALTVFAARQAPRVSAAPPTELFISEYTEGNVGNTKAIEIYNGTGATVTLTGTYNVVLYVNGSSTPSSPINLTGSITAGDVFVLSHTDTATFPAASADQTSGSLSFNGDDAVALRNGTTIIDIIGQIGFDPGSQWGTDPNSTQDNTIRRKSTVCAGDTDGSSVFDPSVEWDGFANHTFDGFGSHTANCGGGITLSIDNVSLNEGDAGTTAFEFTVSLSAAAPAGGVTFDIATADGTATDADNDYEPQSLTGQAIAEGQTQTTFTVQVNGDTTAEANQTFFVNVTNVTGATVTDGQGQGTIVNDDFVVIPIHDVQGNGTASPLDGQTVLIEGIVIGDFQDTTPEVPSPAANDTPALRPDNAANELNGFFVQEEDGDVDADPMTSEGIFVFEGNNPSTPDVAVGDKVRVTGTVDEFGDLAGGTITELVGPLTVVVVSSGNALPTATTLNLPVATLADYEKVENMRVTFPQELTVTEVFTLGRYGEILLAAGGRLWNPTHEAEPGAPAQAVRDANILRSIYLDDGLTNQNPEPLMHPAPGGLTATNTLRGGDTTTNLTGVLHFLDATEEYRIQPSEPITWVHANPRPADAPEVGGTLKVVGSNTLNYFVTLNDEGTTADDVCGPNDNQECRGANTSTEFDRQHAKLINMLVELNADIVGLNELENNSNAGPAGDDTDPVLESIVNALNAELGTGTYAFIDTGTIGTDAIKVGLIYKPGSVTPVGDFEILDSSYDSAFIDTRNRPVLAQTFEDDNGGVFTVAVAHLKSKGSACGGAPDDQPDSGGGRCNGTRTAAAEVMVDWFQNYITPTSGDPDILLVGDLNSYAKETPIDVFVAAGYVDLADEFNLEPYSYVFDGEWGYLDYAFASPTLAGQVTDAAEWHINADEPIVLDYNEEFKFDNQVALFYSPEAYRVSDHDPMVVGLELDFPDTEAPDTNFTATPTDPTSSNDFSFEYESTEGGDQFECELDGAPWIDCDGGQLNTNDLSDGSHTLKVRAIDAAGNVDQSPASYTWVIDTTAPTVTINQAGAQLDPTSSSPINFTVVFSEPVTGFDGSDVTLSGTAGATTAVVTQVAPNDGTTYNVAVSGMTGSGTVIATVDANVAEDAAGNDNTASTSTDNTVTYNAPDTTAPTVTINQAGAQLDPTSSSPINFTVVFSEPVTGFDGSDVTLSGTAGATTAVVTQVAPNDGTTYNVAVSGMTNDGTVIAGVGVDVAEDAAGNGNEASTSTDNSVDYTVPVVDEDAVFVSTATAGTVGALSYGSEDVLKWDGSAWSVWFDGSDALLTARNAVHNLNATSIPDPNGSALYLTFGQNSRKVPGITPKVDGMDIVYWDGSNFSLWFDGDDVALTNKTQEKIDALHVLDGSESPIGSNCLAYVLISTQGPGKVANYSGGTLSFGGEDVLGFCATALGDTTAGLWHMVVDGSAEDMPKNSTDSISVSDDGETLYLTTKGTFNVDNATGGHSMVYAFNLDSGEFFGPVFSAPDTGLNRKVDGLDYRANANPF